VNSPTAAATTFSRTSFTGGVYLTGVYRCTVNDGIATATADVTVDTEHDNFL
jgi:hypothetical protein